MNNKSDIKGIILISILFIISILMVLFVVPIRDINLDYIVNGKLIINEVMANNTNSLLDYYGEYSDYIELYNGYDYDINLKGYYLSDSNNHYKWEFPEIIIKKNEYLIIFASSRDKCIEGECHTNFKLSSDGEIVTLTSKDRVVLSQVVYRKMDKDVSYGYKDNKYVYFDGGTPGKDNDLEYSLLPIIKEEIKGEKKDNKLEKKLIINEVSANKNGVEIKNVSDEVINLNNYKLGDNSGKIINLPNYELGSNKYYVNYNLKINNSREIVYLYDKNDIIVDTFTSGKMLNDSSYGIDNNNFVALYNNNTLGYDNGNSNVKGYLNDVNFSVQGGYVLSGSKVRLVSIDNADIYYTLDGSFPTKNSKKYDGEITIDKNMVIKAIACKDGFNSSNVISRTFLVGRHHDIPYVSISSDYNNLFGGSGLLSNFASNATKKLSFEFYEDDGSYGTSFVGEAKLSGNFGGSRDKAQKGMTIYLRNAYGNNTINYPFFNIDKLNYSSLLLRNGGEDYLNIHIFDAALQYILKGQMDIDMQDYRPVVLYVNGEYYGIYNMRDKLNNDYVANKYDVSKNDMTVIKYSSATVGNTNEWNSLVNYIRNNDPAKTDVYNYLKTQIDMEELVNYWIAQSYYGNTDLGNVKYYKVKDGKWRMMLYDIDWSLYNTSTSFSYPVINSNISAVTYVYSTIEITRRLYRNSEFRDLYLSSLAYHLKNTFKPERVNKIIDDLAKDVESEIEYHSNRWSGTNSYLGSVSKWHNNVNTLKNKLSQRYNYVCNNLYSLGISKAEYDKYFKDIR